MSIYRKGRVDFPFFGALLLAWIDCAENAIIQAQTNVINGFDLLFKKNYLSVTYYLEKTGKHLGLL